MSLPQMDPSSSISSEFAGDEQAIQVETVTYLKHELYEAALDGNAAAFNFYQGPLHCLVTPNQNTVLHVYLAIQNYRIRTIDIFPFFHFYRRVQASNLRSTKFVQQMLNKCPLLLWKPNAKGEIPLHIAARFGHSSIVELLIKTAEAEQINVENGIEPAKQMLRMTDNERNTALHRAVRYGHEKVVHELILADPHFLYSVNHSGETPLYIAARRGYDRVVTVILDKSDSADHEGPCGRTALHAAVMAADKWTTMVLLSKSKRNNLVKATDENGQTPLHYAAHLGYTSIVKLLLECDESAAYKIDKENMTALHMAARQGHLRVMREIINYCPGCCEIMDKRGWNFYHFAAVSLHSTRLAKFLRVNRFRRFLDEKDIHGNTPLQLLAASRHYMLGMAEALEDDLVSVRMENLDSKKKEQILGLLDEVGGREVAGVAVNTLRQCKEQEIKSYYQTREARATVAALIATVAFAAAFTLPGGYKGDQSDEDRGSAILSHNSAFKAFVIADAIALMSSLLAINFNYLSAQPIAVEKGSRYGWVSYQLMLRFGLVAETALVVAFIAGIYAMLKPSLTLAISTCIIVLCFFLGYFWLCRAIYAWEFRPVVLVAVKF